MKWRQIKYQLMERQTEIYSLVLFRILFGLMMLISLIRFAVNGWIRSLYIDPAFHFHYFGFEWVQPAGAVGMYAVFILLGLAALCIALGLFYRLATITFFLLFTYVELIDLSYYLNHYYFISILSFLMIFIPAHRYFSLDVRRQAVTVATHVPVLFRNLIRLQLGLVYFFAGIAKINGDWLLKAQPLSIWLSAQVHKPVVGWLFQYKITSYLLSWAGMLFDVSIPFLLSFRRTLSFAYLSVLGFHLFTGWLFPIGVFPLVMILATTIFFPEKFHRTIIQWLESKMSGHRTTDKNQVEFRLRPSIQWLVIPFFAIQMILPFRYLFYPGNLFWTEEGYRFSWRVMLMEKAGYVVFHIYEKGTGRHAIAAGYDYLTPQQEKMMSTQPDMILQFAHFLKKEYEKKGFHDPSVKAEAYATLNGNKARLLIDPQQDLTRIDDSWETKNWILTYE